MNRLEYTQLRQKILIISRHSDYYLEKKNAIITQLLIWIWTGKLKRLFSSDTLWEKCLTADGLIEFTFAACGAQFELRFTAVKEEKIR